MDKTTSKICFVAMNIYPCLTQGLGAETVGGAEIQQIFIGKVLTEMRWMVSSVTKDFGQKNKEEINGFRIYKSYRPGNSIPVFSFFFPYMFKIWKAMKQADADIYYIRCADVLVGIVALFCKINNKRMIFAGAHDDDFSLNLPMLGNKFKKKIYCWGLKQANAIIVQSRYQRSLLKKNYGLEGHLIRNFTIHRKNRISLEDKRHILWVATFRKWKRPEWYLSICKKFPKEKFIMIGGGTLNDKKFFQSIKREAQSIENIDFLGFQPIEITESYFDGCKMFVNTSEKEGFPNTFLQAWRRGIPVLSSVDPDGVILENNLGKTADSLEEFEKQFKRLLNGPSLVNGIIEYFEQNHSKKNVDKLSKILLKVLK